MRLLERVGSLWGGRADRRVRRPPAERKIRRKKKSHETILGGWNLLLAPAAMLGANCGQAVVVRLSAAVAPFSFFFCGGIRRNFTLSGFRCASILLRLARAERVVCTHGALRSFCLDRKAYPHNPPENKPHTHTHTRFDLSARLKPISSRTR